VPAVDTALRALVRRGAPRAVRGSRAWTIVAVGAVALRLIRRMGRGSDAPVYRTQLRPGDRIEVIARAPR
jgi:hypothetical protein